MRRPWRLGQTAYSPSPKEVEHGQQGRPPPQPLALAAGTGHRLGRGFHLSGLFEGDGDEGSVPEQHQQNHTARFVSAAPVERILATLEVAATAAHPHLLNLLGVENTHAKCILIHHLSTALNACIAARETIKDVFALIFIELAGSN
ncbi:hypothetical protein ABZP36_007446 [Zizania latifolia]